MRRHLIIGLSGTTNSGKTSLCKKLIKAFPVAETINMDDYFVDEDSEKLKIVPELNHANWEELTAVDFTRLQADVDRWIQKVESKSEAHTAVYLLFIEGILIFNYKPLVPYFHKKYFITVDKEQCRHRRMKRHYVPADPPSYFDVVIWPMYLKNKSELRDQRDIVYLDGTADLDVMFHQVYRDVNSLVESIDNQG